MVQVDVFWSYGLASGLALAATKRIKKNADEERAPWVTPHFVASMAWIVLFFCPSGIYLLWEFPSWETMFVARNHEHIPTWLVVLFSVTNVTQAVLGYWVTWRLVRAGKMGWAKFQTIWSHLAMFFILFVGWDGTGFKRFTHTGTSEEFYAGITFPWTDFFNSPVFYTLLTMGLFLIPTYIFVVKLNRSFGGPEQRIAGSREIFTPKLNQPKVKATLG